MLLLAIETSSRLGSVAIHDGRHIVGESAFAHGLQNAARILPLIDDLCRQHGIEPRQITDVAVSTGPGSFTGLRIGVTLAKTFAFATGAKLIAVPSLPAIASNATAPEVACSGVEYIMPILDAKRDQVFAAVYRRSEISDSKSEIRNSKFEIRTTLDEIIAPHLTGLRDLLAQCPRPLLVLGEGINYHRQHLEMEDEGLSEAGELKFEIRNSRFENVFVAPDSLWYPKASTIAHLALVLKQQGAYADPFKLTPLYIRKPEAQERMEAGLLKHLEG